MTAHLPLKGAKTSGRAAPILLDVSRLVSSRWAGKQPTGLDRVAHAYTERYRDVARAVVQHRKLTRVLDGEASRRLFDLLLDRKRPFRRAFAVLAARALAGAGRENVQESGLYVNVGHTEFDLPEHARWVKETGVRPIYFLHDLIPIRRPELCRPNAVARHKARVDSALANGAAIIVNSKATANDLHHYALHSGKAKPPIQIANLAGGDVHPLKQARKGTQKPYYLAVGTHEPRRNFLLLVKVWERLVAKLGARAPKLTIVGQPWKHHPESYQALDQSTLGPRHLQLVERCSDEKLGDLMSGAQALLMPTLAEGFGLPLVEALALGTPVIASDLPSLRESGKGIPLFLDPESPEAWEKAIFEFEQGSAERERQKEMIKDYSPPTWADHFAQVDAFLEALNRSARGSFASKETQCLTA